MGIGDWVVGSGCGVWGVGCGVWGVVCGVCGVGCGVWGVGSVVWGVGCGVWGVGCGVWDVGGAPVGFEPRIISGRLWNLGAPSKPAVPKASERDFFMNNLLVRFHSIMKMIW